MIFPDWGMEEREKPATKTPARYSEWAMDWDAGGFALRNGAPYTVSGGEALQIWVRCALHPESRRFAWSAHSADYGNDLTELLGGCDDRGILESRLRQSIRDTLRGSPYITGVDGFAFSQQGSVVTVSFTVHTIYEDFQQQTEVQIR